MSSLHTTDPEGSNAFYGALFGWQPESFGPAEAQITLWRLPGYAGEEGQLPMPRDVVAVMAPSGQAAAVPPHWNVNFRTADADATADHAAELGGTVIMAPVDTPGFTSAVLADPQGGVFSISKLTVGP